MVVVREVFGGVLVENVMLVEDVMVVVAVVVTPIVGVATEVVAGGSHLRAQWTFNLTRPDVKACP